MKKQILKVVLHTSAEEPGCPVDPRVWKTGSFGS